MRIDKRLNLVVPVFREDGSRMFVHSAPISSEVFENYFEIIGQVFTIIYTGGFNVFSGPRIAAMMLKKVAKERGIWEGPEGVKLGLVAEINRLTNVMAIGKNGGWEMIPFEDAKNKGMLEPFEISEVEGAVTFFILVSCMHKRVSQAEILAGATKLWDARTESLNCTDYMSSLQTLTAVENSGAKAAA